MFYRPSFVRNRSPAYFRELNPIVISKTTVYLIEAKCNESPAPNGKIIVEDYQVNRLKVLKL